MNLIEVGSILSAIAGRGEGVYFEADGAGYALIYNFSSPTEGEIESTKQDKPFEIRFMTKGCILWVLSKCGALEWTDAPYTPHLSRHVDELECPANENEGSTLTLIMTDARNAVVKSIRVIGLGHRFSVQLYHAIQALQKRPFDASEYQTDLRQTMQRPTGELLRMAEAYYKLR